MPAPSPRVASLATATFVVVLLLVSTVAQAQNLQSCLAALHAPSINAANFNFHATRSLLPTPNPSFIVQPTTVQQVQAAVVCANTYNAKVCPRTGGHGFTGQGHCTGVMIDVRNIQFWNYNAATRQMSVGIGSTLGELFYRTMTLSGNSRLIGVGLCPSVGLGGFLLGGGHTPYGGIIGLTCESTASLRIVLADGSLVTASPTQNTELFWASCGGGGGTYGIAVDAVINTADASVFNQNVYFRFNWPLSQAGSILSKFADYNQDNGNTWFRLEVNANAPIAGYGVCWGVSSTSACVSRLSQAAFFNEPNRNQELLVKGNTALDFQAFIGPVGDWGRKVASPGASSFNNKAYIESQLGFNRVYSSSYMSWGNAATKPSVAQLQTVANACAGVNLAVVEWIVCQFNPWRAAMSNDRINPGKNAFANKRGDNSYFIEFIGGSRPGGAGLSEVRRVEGIFKSATRPAFSGLYVSYPEFGLSTQDYSYLYWGQNLQRLANLKKILDPNSRFDHSQPMPSGTVACPGNLAVTSPSSNTRSIFITGYSLGQLALMKTVFQLSAGCSVASASNANVYSNGANNLFTADVYNNAPFVLTLSSSNPGACSVKTISVNGITCGAPTTTISTGPTPPTPSATTTTGSCTAAGQRCAGAPGFPLVPYIGCCSGGCNPDASKGWGSWCPSSGTSTNPPGTCTPLNQRCAGATGFPFVQYIGCCAGNCNIDANRGWGKWCF
jgi:FAD binding domain/Berberine and berberine like